MQIDSYVLKVSAVKQNGLTFWGPSCNSFDVYHLC